MTDATGQCLCTGVSYRITGDKRDVVNCHCYRCRRTSGHFVAASTVSVDDLVLVSDDTLRWYRIENVEYGFCSECGSSLFWRASDKPQTVAVMAGTIDPPTGLRTTHALFVDTASDYHRLDDRLESHPYDW